jgi:hypothetical protein
MSNIKLPTRIDDEYINIEKFEKYEYTHCFTYELARRNINVENSLNLLLDLFSYYDQMILPTLTKYEIATITEDMIEAIRDVENMYKEFFIDLIKHYNKIEFLENFEDLAFQNIKEKTSNLVQDIIKDLYDNYYIIYQHEKEKFNHDFNEIYNPLTYLERDKALTEHLNMIFNSRTDIEKHYKFNNNQNDYFTVYQDILKEEKEFSWNIIYPNFRTSMRDFADTKIVLNLNLTKKEIIDYIDKIKDDYDKKNSIIKTPRQILEKELEIDDESVNIIETEKWADIFFIYDYYIISEATTNKSIYEVTNEIQIELTKYHGLKIKKTPDEIKNKKDKSYKGVTWEEYIKSNPETNETNIFFDSDTKPFLSTRSIENKYKLIKKFIEGDNPKYKTLIHR